jgi:hypothetical protein
VLVERQAVVVRVLGVEVEVDVGVTLVLAHLVPGGKRASNHVVNARLRHGAIVDHRDEVRAPPAVDSRVRVGLVLVAPAVREEARHVLQTASATWCDRKRFGVAYHVRARECRLNAVDEGRPVRDDRALEVELLLDEPVEELRVRAALRLVDLVVRAHDRRDARVDGLGERPEVELVHRAVVDVGRVDLRGLRSAAVVLLLVCDQVLRSQLVGARQRAR